MYPHAVDERRRAAGLEDDQGLCRGVLADHRPHQRVAVRIYGGRRLAERREGVAADAEPRKGRLEEALVGRVHDFAHDDGLLLALFVIALREERTCAQINQ